ncbi:MAG: hypothetical protein KGQ60_04425 [Planctomycetes bacterium]|nr:hypothetical protein [Planctomycetota bacterium]
MSRESRLALLTLVVCSFLQAVAPAQSTQVENEPGLARDPLSTGVDPAQLPIVSVTAPTTSSYTPGEGYAVSMLNGTSQLKLFGSFSALSVFSTDRPYAPGLPLFLLPESPFGLNTNTFDIHGRQSNFGASFSGPEASGFIPSATFLAFIANDSLTGDSYGFLPYNAFGELKNDQWRFAAGLQNDVFNPRKPTSISLGSMFTTGNTGSFRSQARLERSIGTPTSNSLLLQIAASDPIQSVIETRSNRIEEDNGWPNIEGRINLGLGSVESYAGGRKARPMEVGVSSFVGQLRTTRSILSPPDPQSPIRQVADCWGLGIDTAINLTDRFGIQGELFTGEGLGEYNGGIGQSYDRAANRTIRSSGGWGEVFVYLTPTLHIHSGYGIDSPLNGAGDTFLLTENQTWFTNLVWNWTKNVQISNQVDFRRTNYRDPLLDAQGMIFYSEFLWKF